MPKEKIVKRLLNQSRLTWQAELENLAHIDHRGLMATKSYIDGLYESLHSDDYAVRAVAMAKLRMLKAT